MFRKPELWIMLFISFVAFLASWYFCIGCRMQTIGDVLEQLIWSQVIFVLLPFLVIYSIVRVFDKIMRAVEKKPEKKKRE